MKFNIVLTPRAEQDLECYTAREQRIIIDAMEQHLEYEANRTSRKRKPLRPNPLAPWELKIGEFRVFYEVEVEGSVKILAIGRKIHNDLFIRGEKVEL